MLPTKEQLIQHLTYKMTNQDIGNIYDISFQKVIQLIKKHDLQPNCLRKINKFIVYEHHFNGKVIYVGSGQWYRMRRSSTRRNQEHKELMERGLIEYKIVAEYNEVKSARRHEELLILKYKNLNQCNFNLKYAGAREGITNRSKSVPRMRKAKNQNKIVVWKDGKFLAEYPYIIYFARDISNEPEKLLNGISLILNKNWKPKKGPLGGYEIYYK